MTLADEVERIAFLVPYHVPEEIFRANVRALANRVAEVERDAARLNAIEAQRLTLYAAVDPEYGLMHWVAVDERDPTSRVGRVGKTLRAAIDDAMRAKV